MSPTTPDLIGQSSAWLETLERVSIAAPLDRPLLIIGERGSGKELIAERVHFLSKRWEGPYVKVNCAALSKDLLDSELFGHEAGAFTGATRRRAGRFELADGGTLFLDEIATASQEVQEKLLRVIEYGEFQRLGGEDVLTCDVRVVAAANVDLPSLAEKGDFRADLLDRLAFDVITVAPLRARGDDAVLLADYFGQRMAHELGKPFPGFSRAAEALFASHDWPGNVRELKNTSERAVYRILASREDDEFEKIPVSPDMLDPFASPWRPGARLGGGAYSTIGAVSHEPSAAEHREMLDPASRMAPVDFLKQTAAFERQLMDDALAACDGHQKRAAQHLGLTYNQMRGLLRKHDYVKKRGDDDEDEAPLDKNPRPAM